MNVTGGRLGWSALAKEGLSIVLFLFLWYVLAGVLLVIGLGLIGNGTLAGFIGAVSLAIAAAVYFAGTFIVLIRVLGKSIAYGVSEASF